MVLTPPESKRQDGNETLSP